MTSSDYLVFFLIYSLYPDNQDNEPRLAKLHENFMSSTFKPNPTYFWTHWISQMDENFLTASKVIW